MTYQGYLYIRETGEITRFGKPVRWTIDSHGYLATRIGGKYVLAHRLAWFLATGAWPKAEIDHANRLRSDNRWANLREATKAQNAQNRVVHKNNALGARGVRKRPDGFYEPRLMHSGRAIYLGIFRTLEEAVDARKMAEKGYFTHAH